jgi:hypothetical protein
MNNEMPAIKNVNGFLPITAGCVLVVCLTDTTPHNQPLFRSITVCKQIMVKITLDFTFESHSYFFKTIQTTLHFHE